VFARVDQHDISFELIIWTLHAKLNKVYTFNVTAGILILIS